MRLLFLDIDGVLTSRQSNTFIFECPGDNYHFDYYCLNCLNYLLEKIPDLKIVISSSWKNYPDNHIMISRRNGEQYKSLIPQLYKLFGEKIISKATSQSPESNKYDDICDFLNKNSDIVDFVVLDDDPTQGLEGFGEQFIQTSRTTGLTLQDCNKIVEYFKQ